MFRVRVRVGVGVRVGARVRARVRVGARVRVRVRVSEAVPRRQGSSMVHASERRCPATRDTKCRWRSRVTKRHQSVPE